MSNSPACEEAPQPKPISKRKKYRGTGTCKTGWKQEDLGKLIKAITKKYPGITYIQVERNEIRWNFECSLSDLIKPKILPISNPSKRKD